MIWRDSSQYADPYCLLRVAYYKVSPFSVHNLATVGRPQHCRLGTMETSVALQLLETLVYESIAYPRSWNDASCSASSSKFSLQARGIRWTVLLARHGHDRSISMHAEYQRCMGVTVYRAQYYSDLTRITFRPTFPRWLRTALYGLSSQSLSNLCHSILHTSRSSRLEMSSPPKRWIDTTPLKLRVRSRRNAALNRSSQPSQSISSLRFSTRLGRISSIFLSCVLGMGTLMSPF